MSILEVSCDNLQFNPKCAHGPTLKFSRLVKGKVKTFYACSACRDRKDCPFFLWEGEEITKSKLLAWEEWRKTSVPSINHEDIEKRFVVFKQLKHDRQFCLSCFDFIFPEDRNSHLGHMIKNGVSDDMLCKPSKLMAPIARNKKEAQFWFSEKSKTFIIDNIRHLKVDSVVCLGSPTIHETLRNEVNSLLMDIDHRYHWFYSSEEFCWFNMFNFYFMGNEELCMVAVYRTLQYSNIIIVLDPPFGARIEPLKKTIQRFENLTESKIQVFLILPYFMEPQVLLSFPDFKMLDYPIEYLNHSKFKSKKSNKSSPVRIFTNTPPNKFLFPRNEGFYFCKPCKAWRSKLNAHCFICKTCPSKNGDEYKHCFICMKCVKHTWTHCSTCQKCCLLDHVCVEKDKRISLLKHKRRK